MRSTCLAFLACLPLPALAQTATELPAPTRVIHDAQGEILWALGRDWKASFGPEGVSFVPFLGSAAPRNYPVHLRLEEASLGGDALDLSQRARVTRHGDTIDLDRGPVTVRYHLGLDSIEQTFVLSERPDVLAGDLLVRVGSESELELLADGAGLRFAGERGGVRYGAATVLDGAGRSLALESTRGTDAIEIRVPRAFLESAVWPVVVDPIISTYVVSDDDVFTWTGDVAFDPTHDRFVHAYVKAWSAVDYDIFSVLADRDGTLSEGEWIDFTSAWWYGARVANDAMSEAFLVVAEVREGQSSLIRARVRSLASGRVGLAFTISSPGNQDGREPSVGGDCDLDLAGGYLVAWKEGLAPGQSLLRYRLVHPDTSMEPIQDLTTDPLEQVDDVQVSTTNGRGLPGERRWNLVWTRREGPGDRDIMGAQMALNGALVTQPFLVDSTPTDHQWAAVAPPLDAPSGGPRDFLAVYEAGVDGDIDLHGRLYKGSQYKASYDLTALEAAAAGTGEHVARWQRFPELAVDGSQIVVAYLEWNGDQADAYLCSWRLLGKDLIATEARVPLDTSADFAFNVRLAAEHEAGELGSGRVSVAFSKSVTADDADTFGLMYDLPAGYAALGTVACAGMPNSSGVSSTMRVYGSDDPDQNALWLDVDNLPAFQNGLFLMSQNQALTPMGQGFLCLGGPIVRLTQTVGNSWLQGMHGVRLDLPSLPAAGLIQSGQTWNFQFWHRDVGGTINFSNAAAVPFD